MCAYEAPQFEQFARTNSGNARVVSIGFQSTVQSARQWADDHGLNNVIGMVDDDNGVVYHYGTINLFYGWIVLDGSGNLVAQGKRFDANAAQQAVDNHS